MVGITDFKLPSSVFQKETVLVFGNLAGRRVRGVAFLQFLVHSASQIWVVLVSCRGLQEQS